MGKPVRVLHVLGGLSLGGAESRIMDLYRCMDREKVQFDFLVHQNGAGERIPEFYDKEVRELGGNIYVLPRLKGYNYLAYKRAVKKFFSEHWDFRVVQGHMTSTAAIYLPEAARAGIPVRVAHARSAGVDKGNDDKAAAHSVAEAGGLLFCLLPGSGRVGIWEKVEVFAESPGHSQCGGCPEIYISERREG